MNAATGIGNTRVLDDDVFYFVVVFITAVPITKVFCLFLQKQKILLLLLFITTGPGTAYMNRDSESHVCGDRL